MLITDRRLWAVDLDSGFNKKTTKHDLYMSSFVHVSTLMHKSRKNTSGRVKGREMGRQDLFLPLKVRFKF